MRPSDTLGGLPPQFEIRTEAEKWQGAFKAAQGAIREQGEVMSAALTNNRSLWETNKRLRNDLKIATGAAARMEAERNRLAEQLACIPPSIKERAALQEENERLKRANQELAMLLNRSMMPELDSDGLRAELERVRKQEAEIQASGIVPTAQELADEDAKKGGWEGGAMRSGESMADTEKRVADEKARKLEAEQSAWDARMKERALALQRAGLVGEAYLAGFVDLGTRPGS